MNNRVMNIITFIWQQNTVCSCESNALDEMAGQQCIDNQNLYLILTNAELLLNHNLDMWNSFLILTWRVGTSTYLNIGSGDFY